MPHFWHWAYAVNPTFSQALQLTSRKTFIVIQHRVQYKQLLDKQSTGIIPKSIIIIYDGLLFYLFIIFKVISIIFKEFSMIV